MFPFDDVIMGYSFEAEKKMAADGKPHGEPYLFLKYISLQILWSILRNWQVI